MGTLITLDSELGAIRSFLDRVMNAADSEYSKIKAMSNAGEFAHYDDEANAYFVPEMWENIAIRATLGELNSLVEWELGVIASGLQEGKKEKPQKCRPTFAFDLKIGHIIERIDNHYGIKIKELSSYGDVKSLRDKVNSFKHRKGFKHPYRDKCETLPDKFTTSREEAYTAVDSVKSFLRDVWSKTKRRESA
jgi:hypothetical protein